MHISESLHSILVLSLQSMDLAYDINTSSVIENKMLHLCHEAVAYLPHEASVGVGLDLACVHLPTLERSESRASCNLFSLAKDANV